MVARKDRHGYPSPPHSHPLGPRRYKVRMVERATRFVHERLTCAYYLTEEVDAAMDDPRRVDKGAHGDLLFEVGVVLADDAEKA